MLQRIRDFDPHSLFGEMRSDNQGLINTKKNCNCWETDHYLHSCAWRQTSCEDCPVWGDIGREDRTNLRVQNIRGTGCSKERLMVRHSLYFL